jgi:hypothetical protein
LFKLKHPAPRQATHGPCPPIPHAGTSHTPCPFSMMLLFLQRFPADQSRQGGRPTGWVLAGNSRPIIHTTLVSYVLSICFLDHPSSCKRGEIETTIRMPKDALFGMIDAGHHSVRLPVGISFGGYARQVTRRSQLRVLFVCHISSGLPVLFSSSVPRSG